MGEPGEKVSKKGGTRQALLLSSRTSQSTSIIKHTYTTPYHPLPQKVQVPSRLQLPGPWTVSAMHPKAKDNEWGAGQLCQRIPKTGPEMVEAEASLHARRYMCEAGF
ncbi:hypothetical protein VTK26DRAFT_2084 [Humicola hyalothermophila]